jgi:hypothetical protein
MGRKWLAIACGCVAVMLAAPAASTAQDGALGECSDLQVPADFRACLALSAECSKSYPDRLSGEFQACLAGTSQIAPLGGVASGAGGASEGSSRRAALAGLAGLLLVLALAPLTLRARHPREAARR